MYNVAGSRRHADMIPVTVHAHAHIDTKLK